ncbi:condensation domain-containing protein [Streptomyces sp. TBY4]|uniref:condensation domain-containing protein n=1 Tax=Streptomyces sp. TBY4 TaxID=2962030 RepID=UPI0020B8744C|nr:condensation domain-containing protein [Streptomyces sp. TBY4]MCP3760520.1 condensation domain-containing protein [Streptomyces sp. TBY4]
MSHHQTPPEARQDSHVVLGHDIPPEIAPATLRAALNYLVRRHEVLRTTYDAGASPWPQQHVHPPGPLSVRVVTTERDGTPAPAEVVKELTEADFDLARDWPIRACAVTTAGVVKRLVLVLHHIAVDNWSIDALTAEFEALLAAAGARRQARLAPVSAQPSDLARLEEAGRSAVREDSLSHWAGRLAELPADPYALRRAPAVDRRYEAHSASLTSPELLSVVHELAGRLGVWPSAVHLAAYAMTTAAYTGLDRVGHRWFASHRESSPAMDVMACMFSPAIVSVDLKDDPAFSEVVRRAAGSAAETTTYAGASYDEIIELTAHEGFRRGQRVRLASDLNFLSYAPRSCGTRRERFVWTTDQAAWARSGSDTYFRVYEWQDGITLALRSMDEVMDSAAVERFLRGYAELLRHHQDPAADLRVGEAARLLDFPAPPARRTMRTGPDRVDQDAVETLLAAHDRVRSARLRLEDGVLIADIEASGPVTPAALRAHVLGALDDTPAVRCPARFRITSPGGQTSVGGGLAAGDTLAEAEADPGTTAVQVPGEAERALVAAVARANGLGHADAAQCYTTAGGRALRAPRVVEALHAEGWRGLTAGQLAGTRPLRALAERMSRSGRHVADAPEVIRPSAHPPW